MHTPDEIAAAIQKIRAANQAHNKKVNVMTYRANKKWAAAVKRFSRAQDDERIAKQAIEKVAATHEAKNHKRIVAFIKLCVRHNVPAAPFIQQINEH